MKKYIGLVTVALSLLVTACSGGPYSLVGGHISSTSNCISGAYSSFSGDYFRKAKFIKGEHVSFHFVTHTNKGKIVAQLVGHSGVVIPIPARNNTILIPKTDNYAVKVHADHHKGDFDLTWGGVATR